MQITGPTYKWRIDNLTYVYITNNDGTEPFIKTDTENFIEDIIKAWVKTWDYDTYEVEFNKMVSLVHEYENGKYRNVIFYDPSIYFNECEDCTDYSGIVIPTDIEITASTVTHTVPYYENPSIEIHDGGVIQEGMQKVRKFGMETWLKEPIPGLRVIGEITPQLSLENFRASIEALVEDEYVDVNMGFFVNADSNANYYPSNASRGNLYCFKNRASTKNANELWASVYYVTNLVGPSAASLPFSYNETHQSFSFGEQCEINGDYSVAMGEYNESNGLNSVTNGRENVATGANSHAEGYQNTAEGECSYVNGIGNVAKNVAHTVIGQYATVDENDEAIFQVGIGTGPAPEDRRDALKIKKDGTLVFTSNSIGQQEQGGVAKYGMRKAPSVTAPLYKNIEVTSSDMENLVNMSDIINGKFDDYLEQINDRLDELASDFNNLVLTKNEEARNGLIDTVIKDLQSQIDGEINSWFFSGPPSLSGEPACDWVKYVKGSQVVDKDATEKEYNKHIGDTYTDMSTYSPTRDLHWEKGLLNWDTGAPYNSEGFIRTDFIEVTDHMYISNPNTTEYILVAFYYDKNKSFKDNKTIGGSITKIDTTYDYVRLRLQHPVKPDNTYDNIEIEDAIKLDVTFNKTAGMSWRFCNGSYTDNDGSCGNGWHWHVISDSAAIEALLKAGQAQISADGKATIFMSVDKDGDRVPNNYNVGDMWILNDIALQYGNFPEERKYKRGDILNANSGSSEYVETHWSKEVCYTDDSMAAEALLKAEEAEIAAINAHDDALEAKARLDEVHKDGCVYIDEFKTLKNELSDIIKEHEKLVGEDGTGGEAAQWVLRDDEDQYTSQNNAVMNQAQEYHTAFLSARAALEYYTDSDNLDKVNGVVKDYITINYNQNNGIPKWIDIESYYPERQDVMNQIAQATKAYSENIKGTAEQAAEAAYNAQIAADEAQAEAEIATGQLDDIDDDCVVARTEFATLESQLESISDDYNEISSDIDQYSGTTAYTEHDLATELSKFKSAYDVAINALKYHCGKEVGGVSAKKCNKDNSHINTHGSIIICTSDTTKRSKGARSNLVTFGNNTINVDYEKIVAYYSARQSILNILTVVAKEFAQSMENLTPEAITNMLNSSKRYGVNKVLHSRCDFYMVQWSAGTANIENTIVSKSHTETKIKSSSVLSLCTLLYDNTTGGTTNDVDKITDKMWDDEYMSVSIDVMVSSSDVSQYATSDSKKLNLMLVLKNGSTTLYQQSQLNTITFNEWTRLKLTFQMDRNLIDSFTVGGSSYLVNKVYLCVTGQDKFKANSVFQFRHIQIEYSTTPTPWYPAPEDSDEAYSLAEDAKQNADAAAVAAQQSLDMLSDMSNDGKLDGSEKKSIKREIDEINKEYEQCYAYSETLWENFGSVKPNGWTNYYNAYSGLTQYVNTLNLNSTATTTLTGATVNGTTYSARDYFNKKFSDYYNAHTSYLNVITERVAELESIKIKGEIETNSNPVNLFAKKYFTEYLPNTKVGSDTHGLFYVLKTGEITAENNYYLEEDKARRYYDILKGKIQFEEGKQYTIKIKWKHSIQNASDNGMYFGFLYDTTPLSDGTTGYTFNRNYLICKKENCTEPVVETVTSIKGSNVRGIGITFPNIAYDVHVYEIQVTEGTSSPSEWIVAKDDADTSLFNVLHHGTTETHGGLVASSLIYLKDPNNGHVNTGLSGIEDASDTNYGVTLWSGGDYDRALEASKVDASRTEKLPVLITKEGNGSTFGPFKIIDSDTVEVDNGDYSKLSINVDNNVELSLWSKGNQSGANQYISTKKVNIISGPLPTSTKETVTKTCTCNSYKTYTNQADFDKLTIGSVYLVNYYQSQWYLNSSSLAFTLTFYISATNIPPARNNYKIIDGYIYIGPHAFSITGCTTDSSTLEVHENPNKVFTFNIPISISGLNSKQFNYNTTHYVYLKGIRFTHTGGNETLSVNDRYSSKTTIKVKLSSNITFKCTYNKQGEKKQVFIANNGIRIVGASDGQVFEVRTDGSGGMKVNVTGLPTSPDNLSSGDLYRSGNTLMIKS